MHIIIFLPPPIFKNPKWWQFKFLKHKNIGLLLLGLFLFSACQKENVSSTDCLPDPRNAREICGTFFAQYEYNRYPFADEAVKILLQMELDSGYCTNFSLDYGTPLWHVEHPVTVDTITALLIPVKAPKEDLVTAVIALVQTSNSSISVKVFTPASLAENPSPSISSLFLFYQTMLYGHPKGSKNMIVPEWLTLGDALKSTYLYIQSTECWYDYTSIDGGQTWILVDKTCRESIIIISGGGGDSGGGSGTGEDNPGGGVPPGGTGGSSGPRPVSSTEAQNLNDTKAELVQGYCPNSALINQIWNSVNFKINTSQTNPGAYNPSTNTITLNNPSLTSNSATVLQEVFHAYQNSFYPNGIGQYLGNGNVGRSNIEFEAHLYTDLWLYLKGDLSSWANKLPTNTLRDSYQEWILSILVDGLNSDTISDYSYWLEKFRTYSGYNYPTNATLSNPQAILNLFGPCGQ